MPLFTMKMTEEEHAALKARAGQAGVSMAGYVRAKCLGSRVRAEPDAKKAATLEALRTLVPNVVSADELAPKVPVAHVHHPQRMVGPVAWCACGAQRFNGIWRVA